MTTVAHRIEINLNQSAEERTLADELHSALLGVLIGAAMLGVVQIVVF